MTNQQVTPEQQNTLQTQDIIFASIFKDDDGVNRRKQELLTTFSNTNVFKNEYYVYYILTRDFPKVVPNREFIRLFLQTNRASFQGSPYINLSEFYNGDSDPYVEFANSVLDLFDTLRKTTIDDQEYFRAVNMHKMNYINEKSIQLLEESAIILSEGVQRGSKRLAGYEDMRKNLKIGLLELDNVLSKSDRRGFITYKNDNPDEESDGAVKLITTYGIEPLDRELGGISEGDMVSLLAPAKGGKTRFSTYILHNALVNHGVNVAMWSVENGWKGWEALIRARHFNWFYNSKITDAAQKRHITADMIRRGTLEGELYEMEQASWADLRFNSKYGEMINIDEDFDLDTLPEVLETAINDYGAKLICVDYLQLITGGNPRLSKTERIAEAYKLVLQVLKKKKVAGIFPGQFKQTVVGDIKKADSEELINMELRDAGGESYEVIKTPDVNIALYGTVEDIRNGRMKLLSIPSRNAKPFEPIDLYADMGSCTFAPLPK